MDAVEELAMPVPPVGLGDAWCSVYNDGFCCVETSESDGGARGFYLDDMCRSMQAYLRG